MKKLLTAALTLLAATPASADPLGDLLRTIDRVGGGARQAVRGNQAGVTVPARPADLASMKAALDRAVAPRTPAAASLAAARPTVERLLMTMGCATSAKALHSLNRERLKPETYFTPDHDLNHTAMGIADLSTHDRRSCMQVARISDVRQPTLNSLEFRTYFVSPSSGEARNVTTSYRLMDGTWLIDSIGWFQRN